jgi:hypothetical protein
MAVIGWIATVVVAVLVLAGIVAAASAAPDVNRYRRLRKM